MPIVAPFIVAAVAAAGVTGTAAVVASAVIEVALTAAFSFGLSALGSALLGPDKPKPPHAQRENFRNPIAPRVRYYGRVKIGGVYAFLKVGTIDSPDFGTVNTLYSVIVLGQGEFDEIEESWLANSKVTLDVDGWVRVPKNYYFGGNRHVMIRTHAGTFSQSADGVMTDNWPTQWTTDFRGRNIPYAVIAAIGPIPANFTSVFPAGLPSYIAVARTSKIWDPRDDAQSYDDPSTWTWTRNGVLIVLNAVLDADGLNLPIDMVMPAIDVWKAEADYAANRIPLKNGGSEQRYRLSGGYSLTDPPKNWLPKMLDPMDARLALRGDGAIVIDVGRWREPELTISDNEIYSYTNFSRGKQKADIRNQINATFIAEEYDYVQQQADPFLNEDSIDVDGLQSMTLDLDWCPSHSHARRRMKIELDRQNPDGWNGIIITKAYGLKFLTPNADGSRKRFVHFTITEMGIDFDFEVLTFSFDHKTGRCTFAVRQASSAAYDWDPDEDEGTAPGRAKDTSASGVEDPFNLQISVASSEITVSIDTPLNTGLTLILDYRSTVDAISDDDASWTDITVSGWAGTTGALTSGHMYDVRARLHNGASPVDYSDSLIIRGIPIP